MRQIVDILSVVSGKNQNNYTFREEISVPNVIFLMSWKGNPRNYTNNSTGFEKLNLFSNYG